MIRIVHLDRALPDMCKEDREQWYVWLCRHGLNDNHVLIDHPLICDDTRRTIFYAAPVIDDQGRYMAGITGHLVQLEAPALPLPPTPYRIQVMEDKEDDQ
jgi:hypothetical protein